MTLLFKELKIRGVHIPNRVMVSPMCTNHAPDSVPTDFHLVHLGRFALGGAGLVVVEATAVAPEGRIGPRDLGLWNDEQADKLATIVDFIRDYGSVPGIQLAHSGRKGATVPMSLGASPLSGAQTPERGWQLVAPSAVSPGPGWPTPLEMTIDEIQSSVQDWRLAARRAVAAGFEVVELHGAHGYLLHSFLSPISNHRTDDYGGCQENRERYPLEVVRAVREELGEQRALGYRISAVDGLSEGLRLPHTVEFAQRLQAEGVDFIDTSSGGIITDRSVDTRVRRGYSFHAPFSAYLREHLDIPVATVGLIINPHQAEKLLHDGDADIIAVGREMLHNPHWAHHARGALGEENWDEWYRPAQNHLRLRSELIGHLDDSGETPLQRQLLPPEYL